MKTLYESILKSTNAGRSSLPLEFSEFYTFRQGAKAIKDFCNYYKIEDSKLMVQIEKAITHFLKNNQEMEFFVDASHQIQSHYVHISKFRFVKDNAFSDKFFAQTNVGKNFADAIAFNKEKTLFLIFQGIYDKKKVWYYLKSNPISWPVGGGSYLDEFLKKYEDK